MISFMLVFIKFAQDCAKLLFQKKELPDIFSDYCGWVQ